jgi:hypothetical protein
MTGYRVAEGLHERVVEAGGVGENHIAVRPVVVQEGPLRVRVRDMTSDRLNGATEKPTTASAYLVHHGVLALPQRKHVLEVLVEPAHRVTSQHNQR